MICFEKVSKKYRQNGHESGLVLKDIDFSVHKEQFVCILGPSGCGKTTLLNLVAGFVAPSSGRILFNNAPVMEPGPERGVVFQDATLFPWLNVRKNVEFGLRQQGLKASACSEKASMYLDLIDMADHASVYPYALSGGMRQRVAIARVLALEPKALLMDEPFSALDANTREHLQDELLNIWTEHRHTVVYVTHSVEEAAYLADRVIIMGPAPANIREDIRLNIKRPRRRSSRELHDAKSMLRRCLDALPCCMKPLNLRRHDAN